MTKQASTPTISTAAQQLLAAYERYLRDVLDLQPTTVRNYLSDVRLFITWCEQAWQGDD